MIEVAENNRHALANWTERVDDWNTDFVERHIRCSSGSGIRSFDSFCRHSWTARNQYHSETGLRRVASDKSGKMHTGTSYIRSATSREVICKNTIGDPSILLSMVVYRKSKEHTS